MFSRVGFALAVLLLLPLCQSQDLPQCTENPPISGISALEKQTILEVHNAYRKQVLNGDIPGLPAAVEMPRLTWDDKLAVEAQRWADLCPSVADGHPTEAWMHFQYGQNIAWGQTDFTEAMKMWFDEYKEYVEKGVDPLVFRGDNDPVRAQNQLGQNGHFSQMVTALTKTIGCGKVEGPKVDYLRIYICNYYPRGNWMVRLNGQVQAIPAYKAADQPKTAIQSPGVPKPRLRTLSGQKTKDGPVIPKFWPIPDLHWGKSLEDEDTEEYEDDSDSIWNMSVENPMLDETESQRLAVKLAPKDIEIHWDNQLGPNTPNDLETRAIFSMEVEMPRSERPALNDKQMVVDSQGPELLDLELNEIQIPADLHRYQEMVRHKLKRYLNAQARTTNPALGILIQSLRRKLENIRGLILRRQGLQSVTREHDKGGARSPMSVLDIPIRGWLEDLETKHELKRILPKRQPARPKFRSYARFKKIKRAPIEGNLAQIIQLYD